MTVHRLVPGELVRLRAVAAAARTFLDVMMSEEDDDDMKFVEAAGDALAEAVNDLDRVLIKSREAKMSVMKVSVKGGKL